ncbi:MAG: bacteriohemerythrin [Candidatus Moraniibacteriota bacterium]
MPIPWNEEYGVQVEEIDNQHKYFIELLNELYDTILHKKSASEIQELFVKLDDYAVLHFKTEEEYFDLFHYELADEHKKEHKKLLKKAREFKKHYQNHPEKIYDILAELFDFLENWLVDHLANQDRKYIDCFKKNGLH